MRSKILRAAGAAGTILGCTVTFAGGVLAAVLAHLDLPATRRAVARETTAILGGVFEGSIAVERIGHLGLDGVRGVHATIRDPEGVVVLHADDVSVKVRGISAARSALFGKGPIAISVPAASVGHVEVALDGDDRGDLRIANAFLPKGTPKPTPPNEPPGRGVRIEAPDVRLRHAWAHGAMPGAAPVDAEVTELAARAKVDPEAVRVELERAGLVARGLPRGLAPRASLSGRIAVPAKDGQGVDLEATLDGDANGIRTGAEIHLDDRRLDAWLDVHGDGSTANTLLGTELRDALEVRAEAHGDLPVLDAEAAISLGHANVAARANIEAARATRIAATVSARHVDASAIAEGAPSSDLGLDAEGTIALLEDDLTAAIAIETLPGKLAGRALPRAEIHGSAKSKDVAALTARIFDPAMPTRVDVDKDGDTIKARATTEIPDLKRIPMVPANLSGRARVEATADVTLPVKAISAEAKIDLEQISMPGALGAKTVRLSADVHGAIDRPIVDARVESSDVVAADLPMKSVDARARIEVGKGLTIRNARVDVVRPLDPPQTVTATVKRVELAGPSLRVDELVVRGIGEPLRASVTVRNRDDVSGSIDAPKIDLPLAMRLAGKADAVSRGVVGIHGEGEFRHGDAKGKLHIDAHDVAGSGKLAEARGLSGNVDASIEGPELGLDVEVSATDVGSLIVKTDHVRLGSSHVTDPSAWKRVHGRAHVQGEVSLEKAAALCRPPCQLPVGDLRGVLTVQARLGRDSEEAPPEVQFHAHTNGFVIAGRTAPTEGVVGGIAVDPPSSWRSGDLDFGLDVRNDGTSGFTSASLIATDRHGAVAAVDVKTMLPWGEIAAQPGKLVEYMYTAPMGAKVVVPSRRLDRLPAILARKDLAGTVDAELEASGTVLDPRIRFRAHSRNSRSGMMPRGFEADADVALDYDGTAAQLDAKVRTKDRELVDANARIDIRAADAIRGNPQWTGGAHVKLAEFPLESVPQLAERAVRGRVSGEVTLDDLHRNARLAGHLDLANLVVGKAEYPRGKIELVARDPGATVSVRLDQKDGFLDAAAAAGIQWKDAVAPTLDRAKPIDARLVAKAFRAAAIAPFLPDAVPGLDGQIDADAHARLDPGGKPTLSGGLSFKDGTVAIAALGAELRRVRAKVAFQPDGTIRVSDVAARGTSGVVHADGTVKLDGTRIADATASVRIPERKALDLSVGGQPIGNVAGTVNVHASQTPDGKQTNVVVDIPKFSVELPKVAKTGIQGLDEREDIRVGVYRDPRRFVRLPLDRDDSEPVAEKEQTDGSKLDVDVRLGKINVSRGNQASIVLSGNPKITIEGGKTVLDGQIRAVRGWADVQGKKFEIEKATVTFNGESPPNPVVVATAGWTTSDGTRVFADFVGPVKTGKVTLRSEPPRPKSEILALVLFGTADGANPTPPPPGKQPDGTTKAAVGLGGGFVAQGLTEALDDLSGIKATARIDTTQANNPRPELELQISPQVSLGFAYVIGTPPITEPDKNLATVDYRFHRNWSITTTFGDRGTALADAIWQKRY